MKAWIWNSDIIWIFFYQEIILHYQSHMIIKYQTQDLDKYLTECKLLADKITWYISLVVDILNVNMDHQLLSMYILSCRSVLVDV